MCYIYVINMVYISMRPYIVSVCGNDLIHEDLSEATDCV